MLLSESWCDFIAEHGINIGVSLDGPAFLHDAHRKDRQGRGTHERVLSGVRLLQDKGIDFHVIAVITQQSLAHADAIVDFFLDLGVRRLGFNIEELEGIHQTSSLRGRGLEDGVRAFWARLYARQQESGGRLTIREFARAHHNIVHGPGWVSEEQSLRLNSQVAPLAIISVDWRGNLSSFSPELLGVKTPAYGDFTFGNVLDEGDLWSMIRRPLFRRAAAEIARGVARCRAECQYFELCGGGAPSNKYFENGSFESTETMQCRTTVQMPIDVVLADLERPLVQSRISHS
jgi:uncharacterized protein